MFISDEKYILKNSLIYWGRFHQQFKDRNINAKVRGAIWAKSWGGHKLHLPPPPEFTLCRVRKIRGLAAHWSNILSKNAFSAPVCCLKMYCNQMWNSATLTSKINYNNEEYNQRG